jgi:hypothetical protein
MCNTILGGGRAGAVGLGGLIQDRTRNSERPFIRAVTGESPTTHEAQQI